MELATFLKDVTAKEVPPVLLVTAEAPNYTLSDRETLRNAGAQEGADLVIWCTEGETGPIIHLEAITQRATPEVYEPPTISMSVQPIDPMQRAVLGVVTSVVRDYGAAEPVLRTAADLSRDEDVRGADLAHRQRPNLPPRLPGVSGHL